MFSNMVHQFSQVPKVEIPRSSFDRTSSYKTAFDAGFLIPFFVDEALPGDTFNLRTTFFARLATPLHPIMDNITLDVFYFSIPLRLIWNNFAKFFGEQANPGDSTSYIVPTMSSGAGYATGTLQDYMGLPIACPGLVHSALFTRAYNKVWNEWFRDQNLQNSVTVDLGDGPDSPANYVLLRRGKRHDYFTSALPFPQKGPAVTLPLGTLAPVKTQVASTFTGVQQPVEFRIGASGALPGAAGTVGVAAATGLAGFINNAPSFTGTLYPSNLYADLSSATAATINQLRQAFQIQRIYERDARGGTRYTELIQAHFGVTSPDARLQRSEYLGGGSAPVNVNPIAQTSSVASAPTPLGNLAAMGTASMRGAGFTASFTEHCVVLGLVAGRADLNYQEGLNRMWSRSTRFDFYWPALAHIGEQSVLNKEIFAVGSANLAQDAATFGYQERYAEYRYKPSIITGVMRSGSPGSLDSWHLAQDFVALPVLNSAFIEENPPIDRVIAVPSEPHFILDCMHVLRCARPMPLYGVPGNIDRF